MLPNVLPPIIIVFSITIGTVIITEASLSFLGFGLPLSVPSWGGLLSREGRRYMQVAPWLAMWPGIFLTVVAGPLIALAKAVRQLLPTGDDERCCCQVSYSREQTTRVR